MKELQHAWHTVHKKTARGSPASRLILLHLIGQQGVRVGRVGAPAACAPVFVGDDVAAAHHIVAPFASCAELVPVQRPDSVSVRGLFAASEGTVKVPDRLLLPLGALKFTTIVHVRVAAGVADTVFPEQLSVTTLNAEPVVLVT